MNSQNAMSFSPARPKKGVSGSVFVRLLFADFRKICPFVEKSCVYLLTPAE